MRARKTIAVRFLASIAILVFSVRVIEPVAWARDFAAAALVPVSGPSPFADCTSDGIALQMGMNFAHSAVEPALSINPVDPRNLVGSWQQDRWSNGGSRGLVAGVSYDGGGSWAVVPIPDITVCTGGLFLRASDPWLSFGPTGDLYHVSLVFHTDNTADGLAHRALLVSKSTDGGTMWGTPIAIADNADPQLFDDKATITADPTDSHLVYVVWDRLLTGSDSDLSYEGRASVMQSENLVAPRAAAVTAGSAAPTYFTRSTDAGQTWEAARRIDDPGAGTQTVGHQIVVGPDGTLLDAFTTIGPLSSGGTTYVASLLRSTDKGLTWMRWGQDVPMRPRVLFSQSRIGVYDPSSGHPLRTGDVLAEVAINPDNGNLYRVWEDARFSNHNQFSDASQIVDEIAFSMSTSAGTTWSPPIKVNHTPTNLVLGNRQAFTPNVRVAADGTVAVTYYDFRFNDTGAQLKTDYFAVHCHASAANCADSANWTSEVRLTDTSFDIRRAPDDGGFFVGDYQGLASDRDMFLAFFSQTQPLGSASIYLRRFGPPATPTPAQVGVCVGNCDGTGTVVVSNLVTLVNIVLGNAQPSACPHGIPSGVEVDITLIIQGVNNALNACG
jgi:hypothetical protein